MIVMVSLVELEHGLAGFKVAAGEDARLLELGQHPIDRGKANIHRIGQ